jgi:hypothetical protein
MGTRMVEANEIGISFVEYTYLPHILIACLATRRLKSTH